MSHYRIGLLLVTLSALAWSTAGLFTRLIPLDGAVILFWRGLFGAVGIAAAMLVIERRRFIGDFARMGRGSLAFAVVSACGMVLFVGSLKETTVAHVAVIYSSIPFVAGGLAWLLLKERPDPRAAVASLAALVGVCVMVGLGSDGTLFGDLLAFGMTLCMAAMMLIARRMQDVPVMPAACLSALVSGLACLPFGDVTAVSAGDIGLLAVFGLMNSALGMVSFTYGARYLPAIETALIGALDAPLAPLWVWLVVNEIPGPSTVLGGTIVFAAVGVHILLASRRPAIVV